MWPRQYHQTFNPFSGLAESVVTGVTLFFGDCSMVDFSLVTSSATASRWTWLGCEGNSPQDGFSTALPSVDSNNWQVVKVVTGNGYASFDTIPRWGALLRTPSASSTTVRVTLHIGP
jgi:hypothetical protein